MEKKKVDDHEPVPVPPVRLDRFGFVKQELSNSPEGLTKSRPAFECERYVISLENNFSFVLVSRTLCA